MNSSAPASTQAHHVFIGSYTKSVSRGIYALQLDPQTGALSEPILAAETKNPSFLALSADKRFLFAVSETAALAIAFTLRENLSLQPIAPASPSVGPAPCHVAADRTGRMLLLTHFGNGYVASLPIQPDGQLGKAQIIQHTGRGLDPERQNAPHTHSVTVSPDNRFALVCDLGLDKIFSYALDPTTAHLAPALPPFVSAAPGAGPRHSAFSPDGRHVYVINEMAGTITAYAYDPAPGSLTPIDTQSTLPADFSSLNTTAEVRVHPNGRFVYGSNRGHDSLAVFARDSDTGQLTRLEIVSSGGEHPRHFSLSPDGAWLICANMKSDNLVVFRVDQNSGRLTRIAGQAKVPMPVCVLFYS